MGKFSILYKNSNDEWIAHHTKAENENITLIDQWETITLTISGNIYGIKIRKIQPIRDVEYQRLF